ncbi:hypothetical protein Y717_17265 [Streptomyces scopuliridis RB72]|uniref:Uncharacterized protein n=1 Tax=Streptomyces scopuliridis RB72 TaxID=1440053 RepID=A0A2T7T7M5_9ACTN|nr:hypothetical protein Y717_17265 [Streptomyces scopuliridis RB72]
MLPHVDQQLLSFALEPSALASDAAPRSIAAESEAMVPALIARGLALAALDSDMSYHL